jgi:ribosomal 50S subunit-recycling heat shock protein
MKFLLLFIISISAVLAGDLRVKGDVFINGKKANSNMKVNLGDFVKTAKNSKVVFKIGEDAFMAKENTEFSIEQNDGIRKLNLVSGGVLAVFKKGDKTDLVTENMTAGIRGTGVYLESIDHKSYFCNCYGKTDVEITKTKQHKSLQATHHSMIWVKEDGTLKVAKEMRNHTDDELRELEALVGRVPAFDKQ